MKRLVTIVAMVSLSSLVTPAAARQHAGRGGTATKKGAPPKAAQNDGQSEGRNEGRSDGRNDGHNDGGPTQIDPKTGQKSKQYTFGGLDIDGKLKTPQLLYFLNRMKSEFDTTAPDKRSFIPELKRSTDEM